MQPPRKEYPEAEWKVKELDTVAGLNDVPLANLTLRRVRSDARVVGGAADFAVGLGGFGALRA